MGIYTKSVVRIGRVRVIAIAQAILVFTSSIAVAQQPMPYWTPPEEGVVRDPHAAILIAFAVWNSMNPTTPVKSESKWEMSKMAVLSNDVWQVVDKRDPNYGLIIEISKRTGAILNVYIGQ